MGAIHKWKKKNIVQKNLVPKIHRNNTAFLNCFAFFFFNYFNTFFCRNLRTEKIILGGNPWIRWRIPSLVKTVIYYTYMKDKNISLKCYSYGAIDIKSKLWFKSICSNKRHKIKFLHSVPWKYINMVTGIFKYKAYFANSRN